MLLAKDSFKHVIKKTPLVSIDLIVQDNESRILLGKRLNRPAQGFWFVPGGRILKDETFQDAFKRLCIAELGQTHELSTAKALGSYQHFYQDNFDGTDFSTHYIALAYRLTLIDKGTLPKDQHSEYKWLPKSELIQDKTVHLNTRAYFDPTLEQLQLP